MELNTSQPQHSQIISKPSRNPILFIVIALLLLTLGVAAVLLWQSAQENQSIKNELSGVQNQLAALLTKATGGKAAAETTKLEQLVTRQHEAENSLSDTKMPYRTTIKYLDENGIFARVNIDYVAPNDKEKLTGKFDYFICKKVTVNNQSEWVVLAKNPMSEDIRTMLKALYGVPPDVLDLTKEQPA